MCDRMRVREMIVFSLSRRRGYLLVLVSRTETNKFGEPKQLFAWHFVDLWNAFVGVIYFWFTLAHFRALGVSMVLQFIHYLPKVSRSLRSLFLVNFCQRSRAWTGDDRVLLGCLSKMFVIDCNLRGKCNSFCLWRRTNTQSIINRLLSRITHWMLEEIYFHIFFWANTKCTKLQSRQTFIHYIFSVWQTLGYLLRDFEW